DRLEHAVSERFVSAIADKLGDPSFDPHGDPIPAPDGSFVHRDLMPLASLPVNTPATVSRLDTSDAELLQHMLDRGLRLESQVEVLSRDPFEGPLTLRVNGEERVIGHQVAASIFVETHL
ncbi:MAG: metal-dependent transcriptional regulator, partial [Blastochloris sp.]|nr:metal-dependent transcriptional regulator [Blastochloris sp.]